MKNFQLALILLFFPMLLFSQTGEVRGTVYDKVKGDPLPYASIVVHGTSKGALTDINGFYNIKLDPGKYTLSVSAMGFDTASISVNVAGDKVVKQNIYLESSATEVKGVEVVRNNTVKKNRVEVSKVEITSEQINIIPSIGAEADIAQYLQILPGVVFTGDQGGQLYIRGGAPIQNKVLLDGMTIYNPFHSIGLFSVFDVDIIRNVDVYTGGFNAQYGGRLSAIMDITTRDGNKKNLGGKISVSPFTGSLMLEGPLSKYNEETGSGSSFLITARSSYLKQTAPIFYPYAGSGQSGLPYNFTDIYGKLAFTATGGSKASVFGFNFSDDADFTGLSRFHWTSRGAGTKITILPNASSTVIDLNFDYSDYKSSRRNVRSTADSSEINGFEAGLNFNYYQGKNQLKYGLQFDGFTTNFVFTNSLGRKIQQQDFTTEIGAYVRYIIVYKKWIFDPSFRLQYYGSLTEASPEPRMGIKYNVNDKLRLKAAGGFYSQNFMSAQSDRDVVNLFYGFLSGPDNLPSEFEWKPVTSRLQKSRDIVLGIEKDINKSISFQIEGYYKYFNQLTNINREKQFDNTYSNYDKPDSLRQDFAIETGKAYGLDFLLTYDRKPFYFWVTYSIGKVTRNTGTYTYYPHWDRRHTLNILGTYRFGKNQSWETSIRWTFGSGFPFTQTQGFYELIDFQQGINQDYTQSNGNLGILYSNYNGGRLSDFHRLDFSIKKKWDLKKDRQLEVVLSVTNVYDRDNIFYFDRVNYQRVNQLPILPSIGINFRF
jgi:hypothetical protein